MMIPKMLGNNKMKNLIKLLWVQDRQNKKPNIWIMKSKNKNL